MRCKKKTKRRRRRRRWREGSDVIEIKVHVWAREFRKCQETCVPFLVTSVWIYRRVLIECFTASIKTSMVTWIRVQPNHSWVGTYKRRSFKEKGRGGLFPKKCMRDLKPRWWGKGLWTLNTKKIQRFSTIVEGPTNSTFTSVCERGSFCYLSVIVIYKFFFFHCSRDEKNYLVCIDIKTQKKLQRY